MKSIYPSNQEPFNIQIYLKKIHQFIGKNKSINYCLFLFCLTFTPLQETFSQSYDYKSEFNSHIFKSTASTFLGKVKAFASPDIKIYGTLGKNEQRAYFVLEAHGVWEKDYLVGNISIYTTTGKKINCSDRDIHANYNEDGDQKTASLYYLTFSELKTLEEEGIGRVLFTKSDKYDLDRNNYILNTSVFF